MTRETTRNIPCLSASDPAEQEAFATLLQGSLCANCRHQFDCSFLAQTHVPILLCELYACGTPEAPRLRVIRTSRAPETAPESGENASGLCVNCENRIDCRLPKPVGGVWNCEEYR